jgi:hypothetical protein
MVRIQLGKEHKLWNSSFFSSLLLLSELSILLSALASIVLLGLGSGRDPGPYFYFQDFRCFEIGPPLQREQRYDRYWLLAALLGAARAGTHSQTGPLLHTHIHTSINVWMLNQYLKQEAYHGTWAHLNCLLHTSLPSICVYPHYRCQATSWHIRSRCK